MASDNAETLTAICRRISSDVSFVDLLMRTVKSSGFQHGFYGFLNPYRMQLPLCSTLPPEWWDHYEKNRFFEVDPLVSALASRRRPITSKELGETSLFKEIWTVHASRFGVCSPSIGVPMFGPSGETAVLVLMGTKLPVFDHERRRLIRKASTSSELFHERVMDSTGLGKVLKIPKLPEREKACLYLASHGSSVQDIAEEMGLSDRTVETHLRETRRRLNAKNTVHAVAKAVYLGIILPS
jgi:LuxR family quorum-sensing system transcriptional regulator CciR